MTTSLVHLPQLATPNRKTTHNPTSTLTNRVEKKIELILSSYNHIDRLIFKKYFASELLIFSKLTWCFLPPISALPKNIDRTLIDTLAIIEIYLRSNILHNKVSNSNTTFVSSTKNPKKNPPVNPSEHEKNTQMILFGDMLISACVNQVHNICDPALKHALNDAVYQIGLKEINQDLTKNKSSLSSSIWTHWLAFIPKLVIYSHSSTKRNTKNSICINNVFSYALKTVRTVTSINQNSKAGADTLLMKNLNEKLPQSMSCLKRKTCTRLLLQILSVN